MNFILMLAAFFVVLGISLALKSILKLNIGEGMFLAAALVVFSLYLGGLAGSFAWGMYALIAISAAGYLLTVYGVIRQGAGNLSFLQSPCFAVVFLFFLYCLVAYYNDFIQHIDEFHHWAYAVKYMLETGELADRSALFGNVHPYATSLFYLFFQKITGYNEQNMYVASSLLIWIGLMLPFSDCERRDWKKVVLYSLIMYFGLYSLYIYGVKSLYVDIPVCAWAGGLAAWWMNRKRKKANFLILVCGLLMVWYYKWKAGPLIALLAALFVCTHFLFLEKHMFSDRRKKKTAVRIVASVAVLGFTAAAVAGVLFIKSSNAVGMLGRLLGRTISKDRITSTVSAFLTVIVGKPLSSKSNLKIAFVPFLVCIAVLMKLASDIQSEKTRFRAYLLYLLGSSGAFITILLYAYLFVFNAEEAARMASCSRYMALYAVFILIPVLAWVMQESKATNIIIQRYLTLGLLLVFLAGINTKFIPSTTSFNSSAVSGYKEITKSRKQVKKIQKIISDEDRVYMLDQKGKNEYAKATALYYLGEQVSNYTNEPWKFMADGNMTRLSGQEEPGIEDLPQLLAESEYTYLWVYKTDDYLNEELPKVLECEDEVENGKVYRIIYKGEKAVGLEEMKKL